jgi:hypothetical protein
MTFLKSARAGIAKIMARVGTPLAPFTQIKWDQWQHFDYEISQVITDETRKPMHERYRHEATAIGPGEQRLFSIHVAPAADHLCKTIEEKCQQWLMELMQEYPNSAPYTLKNLANKAVSAFPGLSKRKFQQIYFETCNLTGNRNWSRPGPKKFPAEISAQKLICAD